MDLKTPLYAEVIKNLLEVKISHLQQEMQELAFNSCNSNSSPMHKSIFELDQSLIIAQKARDWFIEKFMSMKKEGE